MSRSSLKLMFIFTALGLLLALFMWPNEKGDKLNLSARQAEVGEQLKDTKVDDVGSTTVLEPRFTGEDIRNRSWELTAKEARQQSVSNTEQVWLDEVIATASGENGREVSFSAGHGFYNQSESIVRLKDGVIVEGYGFKLETPELEGNLEQSTAKGSKTVKISGAGGELFAKEFEIIHNGENIRLTGGVKGVFYPNKAKTKKEDGK